MKIRYVTLLAAIAGLMAACGNDRKVEPGPSLKEAASGKFLMPKGNFEEDPHAKVPKYIHFPEEHLMLLKEAK